MRVFFIQFCSWFIFILELTCPENCSNAGDCDTSTGQCECESGRHGFDCSSKILFVIELLTRGCLIKKFTNIL